MSFGFSDFSKFSDISPMSSNLCSHVFWIFFPSDFFALISCKLFFFQFSLRESIGFLPLPRVSFLRRKNPQSIHCKNSKYPFTAVAKYCLSSSIYSQMFHGIVYKKNYSTQRKNEFCNFVSSCDCRTKLHEFIRLCLSERFASQRLKKVWFSNEAQFSLGIPVVTQNERIYREVEFKSDIPETSWLFKQTTRHPAFLCIQQSHKMERLTCF